jgi:flavin-dependent dehydrogenase
VSVRSALRLTDGSRVGVVGGGPAGSFFSYFLLQMADRVGLDVGVDIYEPRDFSVPGPQGCNMCAGVISESLVQSLAVEGINLPDTVVQRGIDSYVMHTASGNVSITTPLEEMRIATVMRGSGPAKQKETRRQSFDGHLLQLAEGKGARVLRSRVVSIGWNDGRPEIQPKDGQSRTYDLLVGAVGVNTGGLALFEKLGITYRRPGAKRTFIAELALDAQSINGLLGTSLHAFMINMPGLEFAAMTPKGDHVTLCLIGDAVNRQMADDFLQHPAVRRTVPEAVLSAARVCQCSPWASLGNAVHLFADRIVLIGDCGVSRLNKDGIGSAYRTAKAAAKTAIFEGVAQQDFHKHYGPICRSIGHDNRYGSMVFLIVEGIKRKQHPTVGILQTARGEQDQDGRKRRMSMILWDTFTGSAPYREVFWRSMHPYFLTRFLWNSSTWWRWQS